MQLYLKIWSLSWPLILANISVPLLGLIDTAILGHLSSPVYLAAVAVGASLVILVLNSANFLRMSTTALAVQVLADNSSKDSLTLFKSSIFFAVILAVIILLLSPVISHFGLTLMLDSTANESMWKMAFEYTQIRLLSAPATFVNFVLVGWSIAWQKPRLAMISMTASASVNIVLDLIFIMALGLNSFGAALASVIAEYAGAAITFVYFYRYFPRLTRQSWFTLPTKASLYNLLGINNDLFIRSVSLLFCFSFFVSQSAKLGVFVTAANAILIQVVNFQSYTLDGFTNATEAMVGSTKKTGNMRAVLRASFLLTLLAALIICTGLIVAKPFLISLFTHQDMVRQAVNEVLWLVVLLPVISVFCYWLDGVAIGLSASKAMRNSILFSAFVVFIPACYWFRSFGNPGLWFAFALFTLARSLTLGPLLFFSKTHKRC